MIEIKKLNETAIGVFTDSEEEANKIMEKLNEITK
jgi:hypothetical protein